MMVNLADAKLEAGKCYRLELSDKRYGAFKTYDKLTDRLCNGNFYYEEKVDILVLEILFRKDFAYSPTQKLIKVLLDGKILFIYGGNRISSYEQLI